MGRKKSQKNIKTTKSDAESLFASSFQALDKYHPGWDQWNGDSSSLKTVMVPPSYDLLKRYVGPDKNADGYFDSEIHKKSVAGDEGEKKVYDAIENLQAGGILIAGLKVSDIIAKYPHYEMSEKDRTDDSFNRRLQNDLAIFEKVNESLIAKKFEEQEIDFIYLHPVFGILLIEAKGSINKQVKSKNKKRNEKKKLEDAKAQLEVAEQILKIIFKEISEQPCIVRKSFYIAEQKISEPNTDRKEKCAVTSSSYERLTDEIINDKEKFKLFLNTKTASNVNNFFKDDDFRKLIAILVGSRPDIFVSPVRCILYWNYLINNNEIRPILAKLRRQNKSVKDELRRDYLSAKANTKTALQKTSLPATKVLEELKQRLPSLKTNIKFVGRDASQERVIYFTLEQQNAITNPAHKLIITGVPGSGKSLVLMMRIFIAAQNELRKDILLNVVAAMQHQEEYIEFLRANHASLLRSWHISAAASSEPYPSSLDRKEENDLFCDEVYPNQIPTYFRLLKQNACLVLSSVCEKQHDIDESMKLLGWSTENLTTHFRSTKQIANFWQNYYLREAGKSLIVGHNFDGIPPEYYKFDHIDDCTDAMKNRIRQLTGNEGCKREDFAIVFRTRTEIKEIAENLRDDNYKFYLNKGILPDISQETSILIASLIEEWNLEFIKCFKSASFDNDADRLASLYDFEAYALILLDAQHWNACEERLSDEIDQSLLFFIRELGELLVIENYNPKLEWKNGQMAGRIDATFADLILLKKLMEETSFQCLEINLIELVLPCIVSHASSIFRRRQLHEVAEYFEAFCTVNTWPKIFDSEGLPSMQFRIEILFIFQREINDENLTHISRYEDFLAVALSRAQSHLIIFEFCQNNRNNKRDMDFITKVSTNIDVELQKNRVTLT